MNEIRLYPIKTPVVLYQLKIYLWDTVKELYHLSQITNTYC
jgi:hypothetical protein